MSYYNNDRNFENRRNYDNRGGRNYGNRSYESEYNNRSFNLYNRRQPYNSRRFNDRPLHDRGYPRNDRVSYGSRRSRNECTKTKEQLDKELAIYMSGVCN